MRRGNCVVAAGIRAAGSQKVWLKSLATGGTFLEDTLLPKYCFTFRFWGMGGRGWGAPLTLFMLNKMFAKQTNIWVWPFLYSFTQVISLRIQGFKYWQIKTKKTVTHPNLKKNNFKRIIFHPLLNLMVNPWIWTSCSYRIGSSTKFALICIVQVHCTPLHCSSYPYSCTIILHCSIEPHCKFQFALHLAPGYSVAATTLQQNLKCLKCLPTLYIVQCSAEVAHYTEL